MLEHFIAAVAAHVAVDGAKEGLIRAFQYVAKTRPDLAAAAGKAEVSGDTRAIERIFNEGIGIIEAAAGTGAISLHASVLTALNGIKFDHQHGQVQIGKSVVLSKVLVTGGGRGATGQTVVGDNTSLRSQGTSIEVGHGCSIVITGDARIEQT